VRRPDGALEPLDLDTVRATVARAAEGLSGIDPGRVAARTIAGLRDGATSAELDELSIRTAAALIVEEPNYSRLAARLLSRVIDEEVRRHAVHSFSQSIALGAAVGLIAPATARFVARHRAGFDDTVAPERDANFELLGLRTVYDRYLLRHPEDRQVIETPQYFLLRVAAGLARTPEEATELYATMSALDYLPSSPTLFNSGTTHPQMSSCYLLDAPRDELESIYERYGQIARLSKFAGGIGFAFHRVRARGSLIRGTNGRSNGIVPWLKTLDASVAAVNQGGRRKGAACVYLESWHADIEEFLELRDNTGDDARRVHTINLANWVPDLFMERVEQDERWSLFDPKVVPELCDLYGEAFRSAYLAAESDGRFVRQLPARQLFATMMRTLAQTGNGWMTFKDRANQCCNQTGTDGRVVHLSNLCTEIIEVTSDAETAVCNLGSVNLARFVTGDGVDFDRLGATVRAAVTYLDRVVDVNFYPTPEAARSNAAWRPVGLGVMGLQDVCFRLRLPFDDEATRVLSARIAEEIYFQALWRSSELAELDGPHPAYATTRAAGGALQFDLWGVTPGDPSRWSALRERIERFGLRNSLLVALAPTSTIASIANCYETIEPQVSNLFKRETLSGEFLQVNTYLVRDLQALGRWNAETIEAITHAEGSVQDLPDLPEELRRLYRTAWELPQKSLIDLAAARGPYVDQSQSLNLFVESPSIGKLSSMYLYAWKAGLKTTYYLRSRPATRIAKTIGGPPRPTRPAPTAPPAPRRERDPRACALENPEHCEACQ
jgi:ribonucleoside-diphosphate reductase alpha chain